MLRMVSTKQAKIMEGMVESMLKKMWAGEFKYGCIHFRYNQITGTLTNKLPSADDACNFEFWFSHYTPLNAAALTENIVAHFNMRYW